MTAHLYCPTCGTAGWPKSYTKGSFAVEILLWLCFIVPGFLYSLWRLSSRYKGCPACQAPGMIPVPSPRAQQAIGGPPPLPAPPTPPATPGAKKVSAAIWGCCALLAGALLLSVGIAIFGPSSPDHAATGRPSTKRDPSTGQPYLAMPPYTVVPSTAVTPIVHVREFLGLPQKGVRAALAKQLGGAVSIAYDAKTTTWEVKRKDGKTQAMVTVFKGRVIGFAYFFEPPVKDWGTALALIDLQPSDHPPSIDAVGAAHWRGVFRGIDQVSAVHKPAGSPSVSSISVTPDKALDDAWMKQE